MLRRQGLLGAQCPIHRGLSSVLAKLLYASCFALLLLGGGVLVAEDSTVHGSVRVVHPSAGGSAGPGPTARLLQKNKKFVPHVLAVTRGTQIEFPNEDLFFHSVFSIHQGKTIDLGLYESGAARKIRFSQPGVSYIFCKIHPEMSAVVVVLQTRFFSMTDAAGNFQISHVPPGRYKLEVWHELAATGELNAQARELNVVPGENEISGIVLHSSDAPEEQPAKEGDPDYGSSGKARSH
jgi:plastocyanin